MTDRGGPTTSALLIPVRGPMPWIIWATGSLTYLVAIVGRASLAGVATDLAVRFDVDSSTLALFATVQLAVYSAMQIPAGLLLDRFGSRVVITAGMLVMGAGSVWLAFAPDVASAIAARVLTGAGDAMIFPSVLRLLTLWLPPKRVPLMQQISAQIGQVGQVLSVAVFAVGVHTVSWQAGFVTLGAVFALVAVVTAVVVRERGRTKPALTQAAAPRPRGGGQLAQLKETIADPGTRLAFWVHFVTPFAGSAFALLWGVPYLSHGEGMSIADASLMLTVYVVGSVVIAPFIGMLSGAYPTRRTMIAVLSVVGQAVALAAILLTPGPAPLWLLVLWMVMLGSGSPASMLAFDVARRFNPVRRLSTSTGIVNMGGWIASLVAVYLIGFVLDLQGAVPASYELGELRIAWSSVFVLWAVGLGGIAFESWLVRRAARSR